MFFTKIMNFFYNRVFNHYKFLQVLRENIVEGILLQYIRQYLKLMFREWGTNSRNNENGNPQIGEGIVL
ncbi:hypothetical protein BGP_4047 [Beggiatoa sp. PS]|nr:hypothetical protein BGP_4047 [Beggiatoa sp. PS]